MDGRRIHVLILVCFCVSIFSCTIKEKKQKENLPVHNSPALSKPGSSFHDTLQVNFAAAVFYEPDSMQLEKIRAVTERRIFDGSMHEYFFQRRNAHLFLKEHWPSIRIIDTKHIRYLHFVRSDKASELIDLDQMNDAYGIFVFDPKKKAMQLDMTNIETQVPQYFTNK